MKIRCLAVLLALILSITPFALAEGNNDTSRDFTADEQAYDVYLDLSHVFDYGVRYLDEMDFLWETALELDSVSGAEQSWFKYSILGSTRAGGFTRYMRLSELATVRYGFESVEDLYSVFESAMARRYEKTDIIWAILALEVESHYLEDPDTLKDSLDNALSGIRELMRIDREYPFLKDLQDYYKDAVLLHEYIADFNDNRTGFMSKHDEFSKMRTSYSVDFDFIFDSSSEECAYVKVVRSQKDAEYNQAGFEKAQGLEDAGDYESAIALYWEYYSSETTKRINDCRAKQEDAANQQAQLELENAYQEAISKENAGEYTAALELYRTLGDYKDCQERIEKLAVHFYDNLQVGDSILFGRYKQSNTGDVPEDIQWIICAKENGKLLLVSKYILDARPYNTNKVDITWQACSLRSWLNNEFYRTAFTEDEGSCILETTLTDFKNPNYNTSGGQSCIDKVFLLSYNEASKLFKTDQARVAKPTAYVLANPNIGLSAFYGILHYWTRSPGSMSYVAAIVGNDGSQGIIGSGVNEYAGVRPALWIDESAATYIQVYEEN